MNNTTTYRPKLGPLVLAVVVFAAAMLVGAKIGIGDHCQSTTDGKGGGGAVTLPPAWTDGDPSTLQCALPDPTETSDIVARAMQRRVANATVRISTPKGTGTGTVIEMDPQSGCFVLTVWHVVDDGGPIELEFFDYSHGTIRRFRSGIKVVARKPAHDLALLQLKTREPLPAPVPICPDGMLPADDFQCFSFGCSLGELPSLLICKTNGVMSNNGKRGCLWKTTGRVYPGRSGSALVDDRGFVVGVCLSLNDDGTGIYQGCDEVRQFLHDAGRPLHRVPGSLRLPAADLLFAFIKMMVIVFVIGFRGRHFAKILARTGSGAWTLWAVVAVQCAAVAFLSGRASISENPVRDSAILVVVVSGIVFVAGWIAGCTNPGALALVCAAGALIQVIFPIDSAWVRWAIGVHHFGSTVVLIDVSTAEESS